MRACLRCGRNWTGKDTSVRHETDEFGIRWSYVRLHGNLIYREHNGVKEFNLCGWNTPTTRSRLNALGVGVSQRTMNPIGTGKRLATTNGTPIRMIDGYGGLD